MEKSQTCSEIRTESHGSFEIAGLPAISSSFTASSCMRANLSDSSSGFGDYYEKFKSYV